MWGHRPKNIRGHQRLRRPCSRRRFSWELREQAISNYPLHFSQGEGIRPEATDGKWWVKPASTVVFLEEDASLRKENKNESTFKNEYILCKIWIFDRNLHFWPKLELPLFCELSSEPVNCSFVHSLWAPSV